MDKELAKMFAEMVRKNIDGLGEVIDLALEKLSYQERAKLGIPIGNIMAIASDEIYTYLVSQNPDLHNYLFPGLPRRQTDEPPEPGNS